MFQWVEQQIGIPIHHPLLISFFYILFVTIYLFKLTRSQTWRLKLPPSPSKLPIIGNLHQLGLLPHQSLQSLAKKYGPLMLLRLGQTPTLIVSSADAAEEIYKTQGCKFLNRPSKNFAEKLAYSNKDIAFAPYGDYWKQVRKLSALHLFSPHRIASFRTIREEEAKLMVDKIYQLASSTSTSTGVNLSEMLFTFTNNVICRVTMGRSFGADEGGINFQKIIAEFLFFISVFDIGDIIPWLSWVNRLNGYNARVQKTFNEMDEFLEMVIKEHIQSKKKDNKGVKDFVDVLLEFVQNGSMQVPFNNDNIKAIIIDMFAAGTDTSFTTVVWVMTELIQHADTLKEVQMEIREIAKAKACITEYDLEKMHYLKMVIKETMRLHIPAPLLVPRRAIKDAQIQGYDIPANTTVLINSWAIARDPLYWEDPEKFQPKRFLNSSVDYKGQDFQFIPFGAGRRQCPAIQFAAADMELPLANLLYHFDWSLPNGTTIDELDVTEEFRATAYKKHPLILVPRAHNFE